MKLSFSSSWFFLVLATPFVVVAKKEKKTKNSKNKNKNGSKSASSSSSVDLLSDSQSSPQYGDDIYDSNLYSDKYDDEVSAQEILLNTTHCCHVAGTKNGDGNDQQNCFTDGNGGCFTNPGGNSTDPCQIAGTNRNCCPKSNADHHIEYSLSTCSPMH